VGSSTIMVVEDEAIVALELEEKLVNMGYEVVSGVSSGEDAIKKASQKRVDLVLMDIRLEGRMDGIQAARTIQERFDSPVVFLTAHADENTLQRAKLSEPFGYLVKPYSETELRTTIEVSIHKHSRLKKITESGEWSSRALGILGGAMIVCDSNGTVKHMNSVAETLTGWDQSKALGKILKEVLVLRDGETHRNVDDLLSQPVKLDSGSAPARYSLVSGDGNEVPVEVVLEAVEDTKSAFPGVAVAIREVTDSYEDDQDWYSYASNLFLSADQCSANGDDLQAESMYKRALKMFEKNLGDHRAVAGVLENLAELYRRTGRPKDAEALTARATKIRSKSRHQGT
jgi:PAS domain S-box-containing protein